MGTGKPRWKLSFRRSPSTSPSSSMTTEAPMEFVCPISRSIMADPVIVPSGQTFERSCIQACPPSLPEFNVAEPTAGGEVDCLEEEILIKLMDSEDSEQESALAALRRASRESRERRIALCTPRLLAALRRMLLSRCPGVQVNAAAALVNLTLEATNKVRIVRSGVVPPLVDALKSGHPEARDHAAGAIFSLALEDANRAAIGVLGAIPPLLHLFTRFSESHRARRDAGMALYHLSLAGTNRSKIARTPGAVPALLAVAAEEEGVPAGVQGPPLGRLALMVVCNLAGSAEGRGALMDAGAVAGVVALMRGEAAAEEEEYCVAALYGMSRGSLRFRGLARAAGAEKVLLRVAEAGSAGEVRRRMARRTLRAMRGEKEEEEEEEAVAAAADEDGSVVSDGLVSFRRRYKDFGNGSGANSAEF
ncbi:RING-type E3 ubiquitin transferase [Cocos nucifera]|uniref:RING-type E3 ubiquitin transferase n=1 Tax=Cocos nucifera TaxID=13894 RepID=A0A8K0N9I4_COCNU|nr:RING-type E3 ubiquitin transferase [Cocos nucifera]